MRYPHFRGVLEFKNATASSLLGLSQKTNKHAQGTDMFGAFIVSQVPQL